MANRRLKAVDGLWLALALLLQATLIFVPWKYPSATTQESITVILDIQSKIEPDIDQSAVNQPIPNQPVPDEALADQPIPNQPIPDQSVHNQLPDPGPVPPVPHEVRPNTSEQATVNETSTIINAAQLLLEVSEFKFAPPESDSKQKLGTFKPQPLPVNWITRRGLEDNLFNHTRVSGRTEIIDQWMSADGGYNVLMKSASGQGFCGKAKPWNPMNPLLEPVIMWTPCD